MWVSAKRGAAFPAQQSEINQSNQKNITEYIRAGRCCSLPSSSIDLQSCSYRTTVLQMKQPNLIFPRNAATQRRYDTGRWNICPIMEMLLILLPLSCLIWELLMHLGPSRLQRNQRLLMCRRVCMRSCLCPSVPFATIADSPKALNNWTQLSAP